MARILAGIGRADITPPVGVDLAGYPRRAEPSRAIQAPLLATTLAVADERATAVLVTCDLIFLRTPEVDELRSEIAAAARTSPAHVIIACSHSHASPNTGPVKLGGTIEAYSALERAYHGRLRAQILASAGEAVRAIAPARIAVGAGTCDLAINRRERLPDGRVIIGHNAAGPVDHEVTVARVDRLDGSPLAVLVHYACHPTVLGPESLYVGPDYVGPMRDLLERNTGATCLFVQGACGNVAPRRAFATSLEEPRRFGGILGAAALAVWYRSRTCPTRERAVLMQSVSTMRKVVDEPAPDHECRILAAERAVDLTLGALPTAAEARGARDALRREREMLEARHASAHKTNPVVQKLRWAEATLRQIESGTAPDRVSVPLTALSIGNQIVLVAVPGEPFVELQLALKEGAPEPPVLCVAYANGCVGYLPTTEAHQEGGYEVTDAHKLYGVPAAFHPDSQARLLSAARALLDVVAQRP